MDYYYSPEVKKRRYKRCWQNEFTSKAELSPLSNGNVHLRMWGLSARVPSESSSVAELIYQ